MKRLERWLEESGMTKAAFAESVNVKPPTLAEWLGGDCLPSASSLMLLAKATGLTVDELLEGCEPSPTRRGVQSRTAA